MAETVAFITYTKGAQMYVTSPHWESHFLDWLNKNGRSSEGWKRETHARVGVQCAPHIVHKTEKREATVLQLVAKEAPLSNGGQASEVVG